ncbi:hypothetical protein RMN57_30855 [Kitasatospora sp. CM 4170]|uniref:Uncharacterized protein n=1 Tax=Kitasatospora aburaviensis TaxID=67265 RepID=A0ABW1EP72_9ACTN|nr:hypothetical protein [Kitasatospora sp. CM 4170]WNM48782.1 hypothetical protein RMN57_30855 [Kitasatospora sp. CM 4170]
MTQDGQFTTEANAFAAAEQVSATLGALVDALFEPHASRHPAASLTALRSGAHPAAETLFNLRLAPNGPVHDAVDRLGTVVTAGTARPGTGAPLSAATADALLARFGGGAVRGVVADRGTATAALFELPVTGEAADPKLRPPFAPALAELAAGQQTREPVELATGAGAEVRLVVPPGFHPLTSPGGPPGVSARTVSADPAGPDAPALAKGTDPVTGAATAELTAHLAEVAEELFSGTGPAPRRDFAVVSAALADTVTASGTVYAGVCAVEVDGRPSEATLTVALAQHPLPITGLATELATVRRHAEVWTVLLPAGPAAVLVEGRSVPVPAVLAADGQRRWTVTSVAEAFVPLPDGVTVLCVQLATGRAQDWELYTGVLAELLKSIQFGWDGVAGKLTPPAPAPAPAAPATPPAGVPTAPGAAADAGTADVPPLPPVSADPAPADATPLPVHLRGTPVRVPPADFNPFAPVAEPTPTQPILVPDDGPAADSEQAPKGTPVMVPPPDFNPFAPLAPTLTDTTVPGAEADDRPKGTPVMVPPPDFNPFAPMAAGTLAPAAPAAPAAAPVSDPFGTVVPEQPSDPFGTTLPQSSAPVPPPPSVPPAVPAPTVTLPVEDTADDPDRKPKGTPVMVPPPDFNPFAPMAADTLAPPAEAPAAAPENSPFG